MPELQQNLKKLDRIKLIDVALSRRYQAYKLGSKLPLDNLNPFLLPTDCSGLIRWVYWRFGVDIPDGAQEQYDNTEPTSSPLPGDLGFFSKDGVVHHVGIYNVATVIEARGEPWNMVIERPSSKWETFPEFSGWRRVKGVI